MEDDEGEIDYGDDYNYEAEGDPAQKEIEAQKGLPKFGSPLKLHIMFTHPSSLNRHNLTALAEEHDISAFRKIDLISGLCIVGGIDRFKELVIHVDLGILRVVGRDHLIGHLVTDPIPGGLIARQLYLGSFESKLRHL